jgi:hypothetical protein
MHIYILYNLNLIFFLVQFSSTRKKYYFEAFVDVGQISGKNFVYIVELHVKLRPKRIKIVEMRAKSV